MHDGVLQVQASMAYSCHPRIWRTVAPWRLLPLPAPAHASAFLLPLGHMLQDMAGQANALVPFYRLLAAGLLHGICTSEVGHIADEVPAACVWMSRCDNSSSGSRPLKLRGMLCVHGVAENYLQECPARCTADSAKGCCLI
jgi:hypothetical protein